MWRVKGWDENYENSRSREVEKARFVCVPNKQDGDGYIALLTEHRNGMAHYGAFIAIVLLASKCSPRGVLVQSNGVPHTAESIARKTQFPAAVIAETLARCSDASINWVEWVADGADVAGLFEPGQNGTASADGCRSDRQATQIASSSGNGNGIPPPPPRAAGAAGGESGEGEEKPEAVLAMDCTGGERWVLTIDHLRRLESEWGDRVRVEPCLRSMAERLARDEGLRKAPGRMGSFVVTWLRQDATRFHDFPAGDAVKGTRSLARTESAPRKTGGDRMADFLAKNLQEAT